MNASPGTLVLAASPVSSVVELFRATKLGGSDIDKALLVSFYNEGPGALNISCDGHMGTHPQLDKFAYRGAFDQHTSYTYGDIVYFVNQDGPPNGPYWRCNNSYHLTGGGSHTAPNGSNGFDEVQFALLPSGSSISFEISDTHMPSAFIGRVMAYPHGSTNCNVSWAVTKRQ